MHFASRQFREILVQSNLKFTVGKGIFLSFHSTWDSSHNVNEVWKYLLDSLRLQKAAQYLLCSAENNQVRGFQNRSSSVLLKRLVYLVL
jgi:hypothetical protein